MTKEEIIETATIAYKKCNHIPNLRIPKKFIETFAKLIAEKSKQEQDEPVGKFAKFNDGIWREVTVGSSGVLLYTHPKEWVGLTEEELIVIKGKTCPEIDWIARHGVPLNNGEQNAWFFSWFMAFAKEIETKLKEKNK